MTCPSPRLGSSGPDTAEAPIYSSLSLGGASRDLVLPDREHRRASLCDKQLPSRQPAFCRINPSELRSLHIRYVFVDVTAWLTLRYIFPDTNRFIGLRAEPGRPVKKKMSRKFSRLGLLAAL